MVLKVNHYAVGKSKKLICEVLKAEIIAKIILFLHVCRIPYNLFSNDFLHSSLLTQFFFIKVF